MTGWAEGRRLAALEKDNERQLAEQVACPECHAEQGARRATGEAAGSLASHQSRGRGGVVTVEQWDAVWQRFYDRGVAFGLTPNQSITRADEEMAERHGERPCVDARVRAARSE